MADIFTEKKRSQIMSKVSSKETKPEILVRKILFANGFRFRKNDKKLPGKPDIVLPKYKTVVFVHGCFWHQHKGCGKSRRPTSNVAFWNAKLDKNVERDLNSVKLLAEAEWRVLVVWECQLKKKDIECLTRKLISEILINVSST